MARSHETLVAGDSGCVCGCLCTVWPSLTNTDLVASLTDETEESNDDDGDDVALALLVFPVLSGHPISYSSRARVALDSTGARSAFGVLRWSRFVSFSTGSTSMLLRTRSTLP